MVVGCIEVFFVNCLFVYIGLVEVKLNWIKYFFKCGLLIFGLECFGEGRVVNVDFWVLFFKLIGLEFGGSLGI